MPTGIVKPARALTKRAQMASGGNGIGSKKEKSADANFHAYVAVRVRPLEETSKSVPQSLIKYPGNASLEFNWQNMRRVFNFDVVFEELSSQAEVFNNSGVKDLAKLALEGFNCTCFAYGQTNSGKTYTMTGPPGEMLQLGVSGISSQYLGLVPRSFTHIFELLRGRMGKGFKVYATYFEIYNEQITDLLNPRSIYPHTIRWSATSGFYVDNLFVIECDSASDLLGVLAAGLANRRTDRGSQNEYSSRSHSLFSIMIDTEVAGGNGHAAFTRHGKLTFVDLAGSESATDTKEPDQLLETSAINKSLLVLGNCISALSDPKKRSGHVPYRDSKLTKLLSDSLGGNGVSLMIACVNPSPEQGSETINTLRYASRAKRIEMSPEVNLDPQEKLLRNLKQEVASLRQENGSLREQLKASAVQSEADGSSKSREDSAQTGDGGGGADSKRARPVSKGSYQSLYEMLQDYMQENETLRTENLDLAQHHTNYRREQHHLTEENKRLASQLSRLKRQYERTNQRQQQQQLQKQQTLYVVSNPESRQSTLLPPLDAAGGRGAPQPLPTTAGLMTSRPAFATPPEPQQLLQQPPHFLDRQPHPISLPPPPQSQPQSLRTPVPQLQRAASPRHLPYSEAPVYVPQPGELTYRARFQAAGVGSRGGTIGRRGTAASSQTVQELARLNANLRGELRQLDGAIQQHQRLHALQTTGIRRSQGRQVLTL